jgi:hypothetical protein
MNSCTAAGLKAHRIPSVEFGHHEFASARHVRHLVKLLAERPRRSAWRIPAPLSAVVRRSIISPARAPPLIRTEGASEDRLSPPSQRGRGCGTTRSRGRLVHAYPHQEEPRQAWLPARCAGHPRTLGPARDRRVARAPDAAAATRSARPRCIRRAIGRCTARPRRLALARALARQCRCDRRRTRAAARAGRKTWAIITLR